MKLERKEGKINPQRKKILIASFLRRSQTPSEEEARVNKSISDEAHLAKNLHIGIKNILGFI
jgi:hypothetical protein